MLVWPKEVALISTLPGKMLTVHSLIQVYLEVSAHNWWLPAYESSKPESSTLHFPPSLSLPGCNYWTNTIIFLTMEEEKELSKATYSISETKHEWVGCPLGLSVPFQTHRYLRGMLHSNHWHGYYSHAWFPLRQRSLNSRPWTGTSCQISDGMRLEIKCTISAMCLNQPETILLTLGPWKNCLPCNWSLMSKKWWTSALGHTQILKYTSCLSELLPCKQ